MNYSGVIMRTSNVHNSNQQFNKEERESMEKSFKLDNMPYKKVSLHADYEWVKEEVKKWTYGIVKNSEQVEKADYAMAASLAYGNAKSKERLLLISKLLVWMFEVDIMLEELRYKRAEFVKFVDQINLTIQQRKEFAENKLSQVYLQIWQDSKNMNVNINETVKKELEGLLGRYIDWMKVFTRHYYITNKKVEAARYFCYKSDVGMIAMVLVKLALDIELPILVSADPTVKEIVRLAAKRFILSNDVASFRSEYLRGDEMFNFISYYIDTSAYYEREPCSIEDSTKEAIRKATKLDEKITKLVNGMQDNNSHIQIIQFVQSISSLMNGWTQWENISDKYK